MSDKLDHFKLLEELESGGLGRVYRARDTVHGRTVLIKVASEELSAPGSRRDRFLDTAHAAAALSHPNIATLFDVCEPADGLYLVFEFIPGETLDRVIAAGQMHVRTAVEIGIQIADALAHAHSHEVVYGDLKPDNVKVNPKGHAKLLDVGLSAWTSGGRLRHPAAVGAVAQTGRALDTVAYFAPEQASAEPVDERADLFSLGTLLFEMLTTRSPFRKATLESTMAAVHDERVPEPSQLNPDVPEELDTIVVRALAKAPDDRHQSAASLAAELRGVAAVLDVRAGDREPPVVTEARPARRRSPLRVVVPLVLVTVLLGGGWWLGRDFVQQLAGSLIGSPPPPVIAVMPLEVDDDRLRYLADGFSEDLMTRLGQIPGLTVVGRSDMRNRRGLAPGEAGRALGAGAVLRGSIDTRGDQIDLSVELVDARDDSRLWNERLTRDATAVFATQTEIAESVAATLDVRLTSSLARTRKKTDAVSEGTFDLYVRGLDAAASGDLPGAVVLYERAIREGEGFAELYAALARALHDGMASGGLGEAADRLTEVAALATAADPDLAPAHAAKGMAASARGEALGYYRRAIELDSSYALAYRLIGDQLARAEPDLSRRFLERADLLEMSASAETGGPDEPGSDVDGESAALGETERQLLEALLVEAPAGTVDALLYDLETVSSSRPSRSRSPLLSDDRSMRWSFTKVPFVLLRSSTLSPVSVAVRLQWTLERSVTSTMKSARGPRPTVFSAPGVSRMVQGLDSSIERRIHTGH